jgi:hypothetical protein
LRLASDLGSIAAVNPRRPLFVPAYGVDNYLDMAVAMQERLGDEVCDIGKLRSLHLTRRHTNARLGQVLIWVLHCVCFVRTGLGGGGDAGPRRARASRGANAAASAVTQLCRCLLWPTPTTHATWSPTRAYIYYIYVLNVHSDDSSHHRVLPAAAMARATRSSLVAAAVSSSLGGA